MKTEGKVEPTEDYSNKNDKFDSKGKVSDINLVLEGTHQSVVKDYESSGNSKKIDVTSEMRKN